MTTYDDLQSNSKIFQVIRNSGPQTEDFTKYLLKKKRDIELFQTRLPMWVRISQSLSYGITAGGQLASHHRPRGTMCGRTDLICHLVIWNFDFDVVKSDNNKMYFKYSFWDIAGQCFLYLRHYEIGKMGFIALNGMNLRDRCHRPTDLQPAMRSVTSKLVDEMGYQRAEQRCR